MSPEIWRKHGLALRKGFFDPTATLMLDYQPVAVMKAKEKRCEN
jgi:hypothetical protein